jgi:hypothetical protein
MRRVRLLAALLALGVPLACGKKGPPLPPFKPDPQPAGALKVSQQGASLLVSFQAARQTVEGRSLDVHEVEVLVADRAGDMAKVATVHRFTAAPGEARTETVPAPPPGTTVRVAIRSRAGGVRSPLSSPFVLKVYVPPPAPANVTARNDPAGVLLTWTTVPPTPAPTASATVAVPTAATATVAPSALLSATATPATAPTPTPASGYEVRRRPAAGAAVLLTGKPIAAPPFLDEAPLGSGRFCYTVRVVVATDPPLSGNDSSESCVDVKDQRPPQPPGGVTVLPRAGAFELSWSPSADADVALYRVYRASGGALPARLAEMPAAERAYRDPSGVRGTAYRFTVTAVDAAGNESSPSPPAEATLP